jgi:hypothetical protein
VEFELDCAAVETKLTLRRPLLVAEHQELNLSSKGGFEKMDIPH